MTKTINATFDGNMLQFDEPLVLNANTRVRVTIETIEPKLGEPYSFLDLLASLDMEGPSDWSEKFEDYTQEIIDNESNPS